MPLAVEPGAAERARHELTHMPYGSWCFSCVAGRGADDAHHNSDGYTGPPRVECDFMFLLLTIFNMMDRESQLMAAALTEKAASETLVRFFQAMLDAWGRSDVKVLLRSDQEVTLTLILREVQARRQQRTLLSVRRLRATRPWVPWKGPTGPWVRCCAQGNTRQKRGLEAGWRRIIP